LEPYIYIFIGEIFVSDIGDSATIFLTPSPTALPFFSDVGDSAKKVQNGDFQA
jgi:hypothetical protein